MKQRDDLRCFIVDDELHNIEYFISLIQDTEGLIFKGASVNPVEALKIVVQHGAVDITFLDVEMPGMSGIDFADIAKDFTHIVFITASPKVPQQIFKNEPFDYLPKPVSYESFQNCISGIKRKKKK